MKNYFKFSIPKPCHEDWGKMTPNNKGRFCDSCVKTVVDFTKKSTTEIQDFLIENKNQNICGHFQTKQLDTITIEIPNAIFNQQLSFRKLFIVAAFFAMGTTLFSCKYSDGKKQKIENVIVIDSLKIDLHDKDSLITEVEGGLNIIEIPVTGDVEVLETDGEIVIEEIEEEEEIIEDVVFGGIKANIK